MFVHKVEVDNGVIVNNLCEGEESKGKEVKYIASFREPRIGDRVSRYFEYKSMVECKNVVIRYYKAM